jgi:uncharacterized protein YbjT (DUF2867 family)
MVTNILVTGATGNVGTEVVRLLTDLDYPVTAAVRNPIEASSNLGSNVRCVSFDFTNPQTFADAFAGINKLFLVRPPAISEIGKITPALNTAKRSGVEEIVFLSIIGADKNRIVPHYAILQRRGYANERAIENLNIPAVFLRCSFFIQNLNTTHREDIRLRQRLFMPAGNGKTSFIDIRDIAAVAVKILTESPERPKEELSSNRAYVGVASRNENLTGAVALTYSEVATIFTTVLNRPIQYTNPSIPIFIWQMVRQGFPLQFVLIMVGIYTTARFGLADLVTSDVQQLLGRSPISIGKYIEDYRQSWL